MSETRARRPCRWQQTQVSRQAEGPTTDPTSGNAAEVVVRLVPAVDVIQPSPDSAELLNAALCGNDVSLDHLRAAVKAYIAELRPQRLTPEHALLAVKEFVSRIPRWTQPVDGSLPYDVTVLDRASTWAIKEYFAEKAGGAQEGGVPVQSVTSTTATPGDQLPRA